MTVLLHEAPLVCCRAVMGYRPARITQWGPLHTLPVICAAPVEDAAPYCRTHAAGLTSSIAPVLRPPADRARIERAPPVETTPDLCDLLEA